MYLNLNFKLSVYQLLYPERVCGLLGDLAEVLLTQYTQDLYDDSDSKFFYMDSDAFKEEEKQTMQKLENISKNEVDK